MYYRERFTKLLHAQSQKNSVVHTHSQNERINKNWDVRNQNRVADVMKIKVTITIRKDNNTSYVDGSVLY